MGKGKGDVKSKIKLNCVLMSFFISLILIVESFYHHQRKSRDSALSIVDQWD